MPLPTPQERPDLYDDADIPAPANASEGYLAATMPEAVRKRMAERAGK